MHPNKNVVVEKVTEPSGEAPPPVVSEAEPSAPEPQQTGLNTNNPYNLKYTGNEASYQIKGFNINQLDSLKITLQISVK